MISSFYQPTCERDKIHLEVTDTDKRWLAMAYEHYAAGLQKEGEVLDIVRKRGISDDSIVRFQIGYTCRSLHQLYKDNPDCEYVRARLKLLGLIKAKGHELFNGSFCMPVMSGRDVVGGYGRRGRPVIRYESVIRPFHLLDEEALFNNDCLNEHPRHLLLAKNPFEAINLIQLGYMHVVSSVTGDALTEAQAEMLKRKRVKTVTALYNLSDYYLGLVGDIAHRLKKVKIRLKVAQLSPEQDVNHLICHDIRSEKGIRKLIRQAEVCHD